MNKLMTLLANILQGRYFPPLKLHEGHINAGVGQGGRSTVTSRLKCGVSATNAGLSVHITVP